MFKKLFAYTQYVTPQHGLSRTFGWFASVRQPLVKNFLIHQFIRLYKIDLSLALIENANDFATFNDFFIRELKPQLRPITQNELAIASPVDGSVTEVGIITKNQLIQAKGFYFTLDQLLTDTKLAEEFYDGNFATCYLAPHNYHRVHMPLTGKLLETIYVPGKLFSVNRTTIESVPTLYARNERLISVFDTAAGKMVVILVGAMIVGSMQTVWLQKAMRAKKTIHEQFSNGPNIEKGAELGHFKLGSTVILLFQPNKVAWSNDLKPGSQLQFGRPIGEIK